LYGKTLYANYKTIQYKPIFKRGQVIGKMRLKRKITSLLLVGVLTTQFANIVYATEVKNGGETSISVSGNVTPTVIQVAVPTGIGGENISFDINPNAVDPEDVFISTTSSITNLSDKVDLKIKINGIKSKDASTLAKVVVPGKFADWNTLSVAETASNIALGIQLISNGTTNFTDLQAQSYGWSVDEAGIDTNATLTGLATDTSGILRLNAETNENVLTFEMIGKTGLAWDTEPDLDYNIVTTIGLW
jgi:hypothetical protein